MDVDIDIDRAVHMDVDNGVDMYVNRDVDLSIDMDDAIDIDRDIDMDVDIDVDMDVDRDVDRDVDVDMDVDVDFNMDADMDIDTHVLAGTREKEENSFHTKLFFSDFDKKLPIFESPSRIELPRRKPAVLSICLFHVQINPNPQRQCMTR